MNVTNEIFNDVITQRLERIVNKCKEIISQNKKGSDIDIVEDGIVEIIRDWDYIPIPTGFNTFIIYKNCEIDWETMEDPIYNNSISKLNKPKRFEYYFKRKKKHGKIIVTIMLDPEIVKKITRHEDILITILSVFFAGLFFFGVLFAITLLIVSIINVFMGLIYTVIEILLLSIILPSIFLSFIGIAFFLDYYTTKKKEKN
jgi:hypothetical protein